MDQRFSLPRYSLIVALLMQGKKQEALIEASQLSVVRPDWYMSWTALGDAQQSLSMIDQSKLSYQKAASLNPNNPQLQKYIHKSF